MLLDRQLVEVDEWLVETVAGQQESLEVIYSRCRAFPITPKTVVNAARSVDAMRVLLNSQIDQVVITDEVVKSALTGFESNECISLLLTRLGSEAVPITEDILIHAIRHKKLKALELLLERRRDLNLDAVWEAIWQDIEIDPYLLAKAAQALFPFAKFNVSNPMLDRFQPWDFDRFIRLCMQHRIPLSTTEATVELIVERSSLCTIDGFLNDHPEISFTA
ncbi:uncharacterized protein BP01DRAFT_420445 [Aspergillus saccharolyticus JOP 1030-1]|uniref:Uncharacterized protein n=1 Tax=Aspergillus saccharolyticus JOP 1030-1 TaxID=1450539 RepID=A0A319ATG6_9EURO|nr:hypothetical protein BP01DRAFT_420445 [Aspergillus saccharolyticus JOP 1030-1]PYH49502.1 hypothetical protein BP01DRAFT_420445 [Aspergillus saccharolyticus JOP 1030-1]